MDFARGPLVAKKAWFFFDREIVCLGAGITSSVDDPVLTSINQCLLRGPVTVSDGQQTAAIVRGRRELHGACWVHHDDIGYILPEKADVVVAAEEQKGDWHDIVMAHRSEPAAADVFSLWIDHGKEVFADKYYYVIVPAVDLDAMEARAKSSAIRVFSNSPAVQAVWQAEQKVAMAAFYEPSSFGNGLLAIAVDRPCLLMAKQTPTAFDLAISNPENRPLKVTADVSLHLEGEGCQWMPDRGVSRVAFDLPSGEDAGKSVVRHLSVR
jgi:chondroitin AC lyase